jgi:heme-degrading monooxygenase HmoA
MKFLGGLPPPNCQLTHARWTPEDKMALISVTRLRVRNFIYLPQFLWDTFKSMRQAERSSGFLGGKLLVNAKNVFWTTTAWKDQAAMNAYRTGGAHRPSCSTGATRPLSSIGPRNSQKFLLGKRYINAWQKKGNRPR